MCARPTRPSSPRAASRASRTSGCCGPSCRSASRARSSARRSTRARSRCPRPWTSPAGRDDGRPRAAAVVALRGGRRHGRPRGRRGADAHCAGERLGGRRRGRPHRHAGAGPVLAGWRSADVVVHDGHAHTVDKEASAGIVALQAPDGRTALPVFTSVATMTRVAPDARPVPSDVARAALSAVTEGWEVLVVEPGGPTAVLVLRPAVWALAQQRPWEPAVGPAGRRPDDPRGGRRGRATGPRGRAVDAVPGRVRRSRSSSTWCRASTAPVWTPVLADVNSALAQASSSSPRGSTRRAAAAVARARYQRRMTAHASANTVSTAAARAARPRITRFTSRAAASGCPRRRRRTRRPP